jgi:hypothetical protein
VTRTKRNWKIVEARGVGGARGRSARSGARRFGQDAQRRSARSVARGRVLGLFARRAPDRISQSFELQASHEIVMISQSWNYKHSKKQLQYLKVWNYKHWNKYLQYLSVEITIIPSIIEVINTIVAPTIKKY